MGAVLRATTTTNLSMLATEVVAASRERVHHRFLQRCRNSNRSWREWRALAFLGTHQQTKEIKNLYCPEQIATRRHQDFVCQRWATTMFLRRAPVRTRNDGRQ